MGIIKTLNGTAAHSGEKFGLFPGFDPFDGDPYSEVVGRFDGVADDRLSLGVVFGSVEESAVELDLVDRGIPKHVERAILRAEIVHGEAKALVFQAVHLPIQLLWALSKDAFGDFDQNQLAWNPVTVAD